MLHNGRVWLRVRKISSPRIIVDDWIISTQKHCSVNFIDKRVKNRILV